ncbi:hypothetical protein FBR05_04925 [Deltaproteobacteria bacterium PRO3]|nr:hypothetical protein [Deltaproteobacteria bacterium PRO3]
MKLKISRCLLLFGFWLVPPPGLAEEALRAFWTLDYGDGSANQYHFEQRSKDAAVSFRYVPVRPEESSTGMYSGGEPRQGRLTARQARELKQRLAELESDAELRVEERGKGTGAFTVQTPEGTRSFLIRMGPEIRRFDEFLKKLGS